jgi:hypothetical protein
MPLYAFILFAAAESNQADLQNESASENVAAANMKEGKQKHI